MQSITLIMLTLAAIIFWLFIGLLAWRHEYYKAFGLWLVLGFWVGVGCLCCGGIYI